MATPDVSMFRDFAAVVASKKVVAAGEAYERAVQHLTEARAHCETARRTLNGALTDLWKATDSQMEPVQMGRISDNF